MNRLRKLVNRFRKKTKKRLLQIYLLALFLKNILLNSYKRRVAAPTVWLDLHDDYQRYTYLLCKFFEIEGYQVYVKANFRFLFKLTDLYAKRLLTEGHIKFSIKKPVTAMAAFSDRSIKGSSFKTISNDYFSKVDAKDLTSYHIPLGLHPNMYSHGLWNAPITAVERKHAMFFAGNFNEEVYQTISVHKKFNLPDRIEIKKMLRSLPITTFPKSFKELAENRKDGQIDIVSLSNFQVPQEILRQTIAGYTFFIACPGVLMPLSHNIFEAISVGTIPIIHRQYAGMFHPPLEDYNTAILYDDDLLEKIHEVLGIEPGQVEFMQTQVTNYYNSYLTPKAIVSQLISPNINSYFLNAERASVELMK
jgi:hypothetical protein